MQTYSSPFDLQNINIYAQIGMILVFVVLGLLLFKLLLDMTEKKKPYISEPLSQDSKKLTASQLEMKELMEFILADSETNEVDILDDVEKQTKTEDDVLQHINESLSSLSNAERAVCDLYAKGHNANEVASLLHLSINTIKTHNKRIYKKMQVTSLKELQEMLSKLSKN